MLSVRALVTFSKDRTNTRHDIFLSRHESELNIEIFSQKKFQGYCLEEQQKILSSGNNVTHIL